jgi:glutamate-1-semialdehyde 2,1-aminomutase
MTAGIETLKVLRQPGVYKQLEAKSSALADGIARAAAEAGVSLYIVRVASLLTVFFTGKQVVDYQSARQADTGLFARFFQKLLSAGIYWPPSQFEAAFISTAHSDEDIQLTLEAVEMALGSLA